MIDLTQLTHIQIAMIMFGVMALVTLLALVSAIRTTMALKQLGAYSLRVQQQELAVIKRAKDLDQAHKTIKEIRDDLAQREADMEIFNRAISTRRRAAETPPK